MKLPKLIYFCSKSTLNSFKNILIFFLQSIGFIESGWHFILKNIFDFDNILVIDFVDLIYII